jgi:hypothetical protein
LVFSFPCVRKFDSNGKDIVEILPGLNFDAAGRVLLETTIQELENERNDILYLLNA